MEFHEELMHKRLTVEFSQILYVLVFHYCVTSTFVQVPPATEVMACLLFTGIFGHLQAGFSLRLAGMEDNGSRNGVQEFLQMIPSISWQRVHAHKLLLLS